MFILRNLLLSSLMLLLVSFAKGQGKREFVFVHSTNKQSLGISKEFFDDVRVTNGDTSYWLLKHKGIRVTIGYKSGEINSLLIQRFFEKKKISLFYKKNLKFLNLVYAHISPKSEFNYTILDDSSQQCLAQTKSSATKLLSMLGDKINDDTLYSALGDDQTAGAIDKSCQSLLGEEYNSFYNGVFNVMQITPPENETNLSHCLKTNPDIQRIFAKDNDSRMQLEILQTKLNLESAKLYAQSPQLKTFIKCSASENARPPAQCSEDGIITFYKSSKEPFDSKNANRIFAHELLHEAGVSNEKVTDAFLRACYDHKSLIDKDYNPQDVKMKKQGIAVASTALSVVTESTPAVITQDVAASVPKTVDPVATNIPTAQQLAATTTISTATDAGAATVVQQSTSQSSGILGFANQVTASFVTPATAATTTTLAATNVTVPNVMSTSGEIATATGRSPASVSGFTPSTVGSNEKVVEEIDLDKQSKATATAASNIDVNKVAAASVGGKAYSSGGVTKQATNNEIATTSAGGNSGGGSGGAQIIGGGGGGNSGGNGGANLSATPVVKAAQRAPAASGGSTALVTAPSREELTTYFLNSDYTAARQKLQDPKMQQNLKSTGISVIDLNGNSIGAPKGSTIILDQGDRFVRQK